VDVDREVRWCLLKLADLVFRGDQEQPPKVIIHLPPTPVAEVPPPIPAVVKPSIKPQRTLSIKASIPNIKSPVTPTVGTPKLRLSGTGTRIEVTARQQEVATPQHEKKVTKDGFVVPKPPVQKKTEVKKAETAKVEGKPQRKKVPKAQSGGMSQAEFILCDKILPKLVRDSSALLFKQPVDPVRDQAPK
jgi:transcription initiation factor TFIID subunit 2